MSFNFIEQCNTFAVPLILLNDKELPAYLNEMPKIHRNLVESLQFEAKPGTFCLLTDVEGKLHSVLVGVQSFEDLWVIGNLPSQLPKGIYQIISALNPMQKELAELAWGLGNYSFDRYRKSNAKEAFLLVKPDPYRDAILGGIYLTRDLINTPTNDMGPIALSKATKELAEKFHASFSEIQGEDLLVKNYPAIHVVGRASHEPPRLLKLQWGSENHPRITLIGKGVCFDSGGLDIKPSGNMRLMKKDMGGAAHVLGLASMIMETGLPICLEVLIPAVENAISGNSFRPGDIITMRNGKTVEIDNTDAEGRLVLADALTEACQNQSELIIDFATLTGAARVALGADIPVMFSNNDELANALIHYGQEVQELVWRLPLYQGYERLLNSPYADMVNSADTPYGGAITAALFLQRFVESNIPWVHFDVMAWNLNNQAARPQGGEAMGLRTVFNYLLSRFGV